MKLIFSRALAAALASFVTVSANAAPVVIDSEQKAAAALYTAEHLAIDHFSVTAARTGTASLSFRPRDVAVRAFSILEAATTLPELLAMRGGNTFACPLGGSLHARLTRGNPRVLKLQWNDCLLPDFDANVTWNGATEVTLCEESLAPSRVSAIRVGSGTGDMVATSSYREGEGDAWGYMWVDTQTTNLRIAGDIPVAQTPGGAVFGDFSFTLSGFHASHNVFTPNGAPSTEYAERFTAENLVASGSTQYFPDDPTFDEHLILHRGTLSRVVESFLDRSESFTANNLRMYASSHYPTLRTTVTLDGRADFQWGPSSGAGCLNGAYTFRTRSPLTGPFGFSTHDGGELIINGSTSVRYFSAATVPAHLPVPARDMLVNINVRNVGSFNFDLANSVRLGLREMAQCGNGL